LGEAGQRRGGDVFVDTEDVMSICGVEVGEKDVGEGTSCSDGEQAVMKASSVKSIIVHFVA